MGYLLKNTSALIDIKLTDAARKRISEGKFDISFFQVGDSEVCYNCVDGQTITDQNVISSNYNDQNNSGVPEKNKSLIKYPLYVGSTGNNTFGIPINQPQVDEVYNTASPRGFFYGENINETYSNVFLSENYCITGAYQTAASSFMGGNSFTVTENGIVDIENQPQIGDYVTVYFTGLIDPITDNNPVITYKIVDLVVGGELLTVTVDRLLPNLSQLGNISNIRVIFYPNKLAPFYDFLTPDGYYLNEEINFENNCDSNGKDVKIWNMNIPWRESVAGTFSTSHKGYESYGSVNYINTMQYLGYYSNDGQTSTDSTYFYDSFEDRIDVDPNDQKCISIIHYSNNTIDNFYGEKLSLKPFNNTDTGSAKNFAIEIPWLMWHKNKNGTIGEKFMVDPDGFEGLNLFEVQSMNSNKNAFMSDPGLRYYNLWDTHPNEDGYPNRVGKVWPDLKMITIDDEEIVAAMSYKSNRSWTLPAPKVSLVTPNTFGGLDQQNEGVLNGSGETMYVTYRFTNSYSFNSLHCNYYIKVQGKEADCPPYSSNVLVNFGKEFKFLNSQNQNEQPVLGFIANKIELVVQKVQTGQKPVANGWKVIDVTNQIENVNQSNLLSETLISNTSFQISKVMYDSAASYKLNDYIQIPESGSGNEQLNFGDEFFFYGTVKSDIQATIYVMNYAVNLGSSQFQRSSNPTATQGTTPYVTEVGLFDSNKDLMVVAKLQSPTVRGGTQQYSLKLDF